MRRVLFIALCLLTNFVLGQTLQDQVDELEAELRGMADSGKVFSYNRLADIYMGLDPDQARKYIDLARAESIKYDLEDQQAITEYLSASLYNLLAYGEEAHRDYLKAGILAQSSGNLQILSEVYSSLSSIAINDQEKDLADAYLDSLRLIAEGSTDTLILANYQYVVGEHQVNHGSFNEAIKSLNSALNLYHSLNDYDKIIEVLNTLGFLYLDNYFNDQGQIYFEYALQISKSIGSYVELSFLNNSIANNYMGQGEFETATSYYVDAIKYSEQTGNNDALIVLYSNLATCYIEIKDFKKAQKTLDKALREIKKTGNTFYSPYIQFNMGYMKFKQEDYYEAIPPMKDAIPLLKQNKDQAFLITDYLFIADSYAALDSFDIAQIYIDSAWRLTESSNQVHLEMMFQDFSYKYSLSKGDSIQALVHLEKYTDLKDSTESITSQNKLIFETNILKGALQTENISLKKSVESKQEKLLRMQILIALLVAIGIIVVFMVITILRVRSNKKLKEVNLQLAELIEERTKDLKGEIKQRAIIEEELLEINDRFEKLTQSIPDITWSSRITAGGTNTLVYLSPQIQELTNHKVSDYKSNPEIWSNEVVHPDDRASVLAINQKVNSGDVPVAEIEYRIRDKNGEIRWIHEKINVAKESGGVRLDAIISDVTKQKDIEIKLRLSQEKLEELNATKDKFFSIIAHDLKNPFNSILGFANLLRENYDEFDKEEHFTFIENIRNASDSAYKLLQNLLEWSRSQTGRLEVKPETFDVSEVVNNNLSLLNPLAQNKHIKLSTTVEFNTNVFADKNMIHTIVRNLIQNAIKFSHPESQIMVFAETGADFVYVSVRDEGVGIDEDKISKLFRIDTQIKTKGTAKEQGTGLGLLLCKEFIEQNHGEIQVESKVGEGSTFTISIPMVKMNV